MKVKISGKNIEITEALRNAIQTKLERIGKYFQTDTEAQVTLSVEKNRQIDRRSEYSGEWFVDSGRRGDR